MSELPPELDVPCPPEAKEAVRRGVEMAEEFVRTGSVRLAAPSVERDQGSSLRDLLDALRYADRGGLVLPPPRRAREQPLLRHIKGRSPCRRARIKGQVMTTTPVAGMRLAPCPHCGADLVKSEQFSTRGSATFVHEPTGCFCDGVIITDKSTERAAAWNTRAAAPVPPAGGEGEVETLLADLKKGRDRRETTDPVWSEFNRHIQTVEALAARAQPPVGTIEVEGGTLPNGVYRRDDGQRLMVVKNDEVRFYTAHPAEPAARPKTAAELTSIIRAWLDADDPSHWGEFERRLDAALAAGGEK